ncbi:cytochrome P450 [Actinosynnema sp. NPDC047251]|uniref:Cytochrome P450 monooxygenase n=1 Tax=Saccharothrix espanaensis (strain ATCC 51144 / DSM 44229 / JCM 9112 / NBRC 15066 / NRRL 15764) TaxID=1179773 RepID=K0JYB1_SACES|nr:cytochrome P450 [Saccharothrix espanaensis]CCH32935.1 Cytochrome P450 monooxygenase [Saccharothrix espanaensis DSM 44229]
MNEEAVVVPTTGPSPTALAEIDLYDVELYRTGDPHAAWRALRDEAPVWRQTAPDGTPFWSVTRYADVVAVLGDTERFSSEHSTMLSVLHGDSAKGRAIHLMDPPRHGRLRAGAVRSMSMKVMREHEDDIRGRIRRLVADAVDRRESDFAELVSRLPMLVAGELMGIPAGQWEEAAHWTVAGMAPEDPAYHAGEVAETLLQAHVFLFSLFSALVEERRADPGEDLVSALLGTEVDGGPLTDDDVLVNCYAFIMGANPTIPQAAGHLALLLSQEPVLWQRIRADRSLVGGVVEEALRWGSPVNHLLRRTTTEVRLGAATIPEGGLVAAWLGSANRDERTFPDPYTFDPGRKPNPHIAFGHGPHRCIGLSAARVGLQLLVEELLDAVERFEPAGEVRRLGSNFLNGLTSLPLVLHRAGA